MSSTPVFFVVSPVRDTLIGSPTGIAMAKKPNGQHVFYVEPGILPAEVATNAIRTKLEGLDTKIPGAEIIIVAKADTAYSSATKDGQATSNLDLSAALEHFRSNFGSGYEAEMVIPTPGIKVHNAFTTQFIIPIDQIQNEGSAERYLQIFNQELESKQRVEVLLVAGPGANGTESYKALQTTQALSKLVNNPNINITATVSTLHEHVIKGPIELIALPSTLNTLETPAKKIEKNLASSPTGISMSKERDTENQIFFVDPIAITAQDAADTILNKLQRTGIPATGYDVILVAESDYVTKYSDEISKKLGIDIGIISPREIDAYMSNRLQDPEDVRMVVPRYGMLHESAEVIQLVVATENITDGSDVQSILSYLEGKQKLVELVLITNPDDVRAEYEQALSMAANFAALTSLNPSAEISTYAPTDKEYVIAGRILKHPTAS